MKVLIATDGSKFSEAAIDSVCARTWPEGTEFIVLGVVEPILLAVDPVFAPSEMSAREDERTFLERCVGSSCAVVMHRFPDASVQSLVKEGDAAPEIVATAKELDVDMVVVGSHGRRGLLKFLLGSVAEAVVGQCSCTVEVVRLPRRRPGTTNDMPAAVSVK